MPTPHTLIEDYDPGAFYDEMVTPDQQPRAHYRAVSDYLQTLTPAALA